MTGRQPRRSAAKDPASRAESGPNVRYADALEELEKILEDLENDAIDVDDLTARVKRASELIVLCRDRLTRTKLEIEQIVASLEGLDEDEGHDGEEDVDADGDEEDVG
jgi:exodeoxyribonuclease VII small subunit